MFVQQLGAVEVSTLELIVGTYQQLGHTLRVTDALQPSPGLMGGIELDGLTLADGVFELQVDHIINFEPGSKVIATGPSLTFDPSNTLQTDLMQTVVELAPTSGVTMTARLGNGGNLVLAGDPNLVSLQTALGCPFAIYGDLHYQTIVNGAGVSGFNAPALYGDVHLYVGATADTGLLIDLQCFDEATCIPVAPVTAQDCVDAYPTCDGMP